MFKKKMRSTGLAISPCKPYLLHVFAQISPSQWGPLQPHFKHCHCLQHSWNLLSLCYPFFPRHIQENVSFGQTLHLLTLLCSLLIVSFHTHTITRTGNLCEFYSLMYFKYLEQCLAQSKHSIKCCWMKILMFLSEPKYILYYLLKNLQELLRTYNKNDHFCNECIQECRQ